MPGPLCVIGCGHICLINCGGRLSGGGGGGGDCIGPGCDSGDCVGAGCESNSQDENSSTSSCSEKTVTDYWVSCSSDVCSSKSLLCFLGYVDIDQLTLKRSHEYIRCLRLLDHGHNHDDRLCLCYVSTLCPSGSLRLPYRQTNLCPNSPTYDANLEDVGDELPSGASFVEVTTTMSEGVRVGSSYYTVHSDHFTISGTAVSVVSVTVTSIITFAGTTGTLFPQTVQVVSTYNDWASWGVSSPAATPLLTATTTITQVTTTTQVSTPEPSNYVFIDLLEWVPQGTSDEVQEWDVFTHDASTFYPCDDTSVASSGQTDLIPGENQGYPDLDISFPAHGIDGCRYVGTSSAVGEMTCPGISSITCVRDSQFGDTLLCESGDAAYYPDVWCRW